MIDNSALRPGTVALVTGAGRRHGVGRACALALARAGADVAVHGSHRGPNAEEEASGWAGAESVAGEIRALGRRAVAIELDLSLREAPAELVKRASDELGPVTVLVNNAGSNVGGGLSVTELPDDDWYAGIDVNLHAVYGACKAAIPEMIEAGHGAIVNVSSLAGLRARGRYGSYCAAKFAVVGFTEQLALELAPTVRANCVCPGLTLTDMTRDSFSKNEERLGLEPGYLYETLSAQIPMGRMAHPEEMAAVVAFLASDAAGYVTGQSVRVDGGMDLVNIS